MVDRPSVPADVSRRLRRESGFGCCVCGFPVIQYHHVVPWHEDNHFRPEDMMTLCPLCHDRATKGFMSETEQRRAKGEPFNILRGYSTGTFFANQDYAAVALGSSLLVGDENFIQVDGRKLLRLGVTEHGDLSLSASFEDESGAAVALIEDNEWVSGDPSLWDFKADHGKLKIWSAPRRIALELDARQEPISIRGEMWRNGVRVHFRKQGLEIEQNDVSAKLSHMGLVGLGIDVTTKTGEVKLTSYLRRGLIVSAPQHERLAKCREAWNRLNNPSFFA